VGLTITYNIGLNGGVVNGPDGVFILVNTVMKIQELMQRNPPQTKNEFVDPDSDYIGSGMQSKVYPHPTHSDRVVKVVKVFNPRNDSYVNFIRLITEHQNNPFFPRIYSAKMHKMPDSAETSMSYRLIMVMEKLHELDDERLMDAAEENLVRLGIPPEYIRDANNSDKMSVFFASPERRRDLAQNTNNPQFKEAIELLEPYFEAFGQDMHSGNAMIRLTGSGPQIVIIDPLELG